jgi:hypothetical protein
MSFFGSLRAHLRELALRGKVSRHYDFSHVHSFVLMCKVQEMYIEWVRVTLCADVLTATTHMHRIEMAASPTSCETRYRHAYMPPPKIYHVPRGLLYHS